MISSNVCGSVTEEGKRTCPLTDRSVSEAFRLPSSVTAPQSFLFIWCFFISLRGSIGNILLRCRATFSSGEGFGAEGNPHKKSLLA